MIKDIVNQAKSAAEQLLKIAGLEKGDIVVVGCSTSEILGEKIGTYSNPEVGAAIFEAINSALAKKGIFLAAQCCEHLNRALIVEEEFAKKNNLEIVNVVPRPKAGGSFASAAYSAFKRPVAIEYISAKAGLDIGGTLIGMHLAKVAVPVRLDIKKVGEANLVAARVRPKFIGGDRAVYDKDLM